MFGFKTIFNQLIEARRDNEALLAKNCKSELRYRVSCDDD